MTDLGVGLLYCADFQFFARIPLPTRYAGHPPPGGGDFYRPVGAAGPRHKSHRRKAIKMGPGIRGGPKCVLWDYLL